jgi:hypothetical protein
MSRFPDIFRLGRTTGVSEVSALSGVSVFSRRVDPPTVLRSGVLPKFRLLPEFRLLDVPAFLDVSEFSVASTRLLGIDHTGRHRTSRSASISLLIGIDHSGWHLIGPSNWHRPVLLVGISSALRPASTSLLVGIDLPISIGLSTGIDQSSWSASTLPVSLDSSSQHRPAFWSASAFRPASAFQPASHRPFGWHRLVLLVGIDPSGQ